MKIPTKQKLRKIYEIKLGRTLYINIWFLPVAICAFFGGYGHMFFITFLMAFLHETAHVLCAMYLNVSVSRIIILPFGMTARLAAGYIKRSEKEFLIAFAGPFLSLILFWLFIIAANTFSYSLLYYCADVNLIICLANLIPCLPLDGGRMLKSILASQFGFLRSYNFMLRLSRILVAILAIFALYIFFASHFNFSLILISAFIFQNLSCEQNSVSHIAVKEILENSHKLKNREKMHVKTFCVTESCPASSILKHLGYDYYCIIHVADKDSHVIKTLTETQVLAALTSYGIRVKYGEI